MKGLGKEAKSSDYYRQKQASCLGFGIYYSPSEKLPNGVIGPRNLGGDVQVIRVDIFSDCLEQDANAVLRAFRFLREQEFYKNIEKSKIHLWSDCGSHFRNKTLMHYFFIELAEIGVQVNFNFFVEKHVIYFKILF